MNKTTPRDFFLHLGALIALFVSVIAATNASFGVINYFIPDALGSMNASGLRLALSLLIIFTPILYVLEYVIIRSMRADTGKRELWIERWRAYFILFMAGLTLAVDLVALLNTFLNGELSERFILKVVAIVILAGTVFAYYLLRRIRYDRTLRFRSLIAWIMAVVILALVIVGFLDAGSPVRERESRFDSERISDLQNIQSEVISYWQMNSQLPASASLSSIMTYSSIADPETMKPYGYALTASSSFELCADFNLPSSSESGTGTIYNEPMIPAGASASVNSMNQNWIHPAGHYCFVRTLDPRLYPPEK